MKTMHPSIARLITALRLGTETESQWIWCHDVICAPESNIVNVRNYLIHSLVAMYS